jgi:surface polysaccharide O-acyltransferase-like enzyme
MYIGFYLAGQYVDKYKNAAGGHDWQQIWVFPALFAAGVALLFIVLFRNDQKKALAEQP